MFMLWAAEFHGNNLLGLLYPVIKFLMFILKYDKNHILIYFLLLILTLLVYPPQNVLVLDRLFAKPPVCVLMFFDTGM